MRLHTGGAAARLDVHEGCAWSLGSARAMVDAAELSGGVGLREASEVEIEVELRRTLEALLASDASRCV
jgi:hypothetical protein